jgi:hypothetical protein
MAPVWVMWRAAHQPTPTSRAAATASAMARVSATAAGARSASSTTAAAPGLRVTRMLGLALIDLALTRST